ncbi:ComEC/Rec2 family competence protein [Helicobacter baculiformis]|uniref:ComEC/Rec2 family competence protein n=1 Tax=Helicobacter baculiformis TaxID=427351 RepID=A0ABV7ZHZ3_9HELI|nr:ComEC/Rec2 family competence protein [Helicobacter baculiformis]
MTFSQKSPFQLPLLQNAREWFIVLGVLLCVGILSLCMKYAQYQHFKAKKPISVYAQVRLQYSKVDSQGRAYFVLKLQDQHGNVLYTTSKEKIKDLSYAFVRAYGKMSPCSFVKFLKACYFQTFYLALEPTRDYKDFLRTHLNAQHTDSRMGNFYNTLFLADPLDKPTRELSTKLGISHIIAISGFHLGILGAFFYALLSLFYRPLQQRFFPYRNAHYDLGAGVFVLLFAYLVLLDFQPSFLRAFVMALIGFGLYYNALQVLNFSLLLLAICLCCAFSPGLLGQVGFLLSVCGVFYIYLFLKYTPKMPAPFYALLLNLVVFLHMLPIVHVFFTPFSLYQLTSIPLSFVFVIFFPLSLFLHALGWGGFADPYLLQALEWQIPSIDYTTPLWGLVLYASLSLCALRYVYAYWGVHALSLGLFGALTWRYLQVVHGF